jgi:hypothetical protein
MAGDGRDLEVRHDDEAVSPCNGFKGIISSPCSRGSHAANE